MAYNNETEESEPEFPTMSEEDTEEEGGGEGGEEPQEDTYQ